MNHVLSSAHIGEAVERIGRNIDAIRDALNEADRVLGDGDTGMTIAQVVAAWQRAVAALPADVGATVVSLGRETRRASGSSFGSVLAIGLTAAGKHAGAQAQVDRAGLVAMVAAATAAITERSGASAGDKTVLDSLLRIGRDLAAARDGDALLDVAMVAAEGAVADFRTRASRIGRARIYGEKSIGHDDPGMLAALLLLRAARRR